MAILKTMILPDRGETAGGASRAGVWWRGLVFLVLALFLGPGLSSARGQISREYQLKAVFLYNFVQFTEWPSSAFSAPDSPLVIGVLGADPFGKVLDDIVQNETVRGRKLVVERYQRLEDVKPCHILYISQSEAPRLDRIVSNLKGRPILTVSDIEGAAFRGVMMRFLVADNKIRLRVNLDAVKEAGIVLSSQLLRTVEIVSTQGPP